MNSLRNSIEELKKVLDVIDIDKSLKLDDKFVALMHEVDACEKKAKILEQNMQDIQKQYDFLEASIDALPNPLFLKNSKGEFVYFNAEYQKYFNMKQEVYLGKTVLDLEFLPMEERERYQREDLNLIETGEIRHYEIDFKLPDGEIGNSLYWSRGFEVSNGGNKGLVGEIVDITMQKKLRDEIKRNAQKLEAANKSIERMMKEDFLTGLFNRRAIDEIMSKIRYMLKDKRMNISIIMADLDDFKKINDTYGHGVGDEVLVKFSEVLKICNRRDDLVVRFGGEEFLVVLFEANSEQAFEVAERIRRTTEETLVLLNGEKKTVSIGVTEISANETLDEAIERVDSALYEAKKTGKNKVVLRAKPEI